MVFDRSGSVVASDQREHRQILPRGRLGRHDPMEIWENTRAVVGGALGKANLSAKRVITVGICSARDDRRVGPHDGPAIHNAIVWQDTRTPSRSVMSWLARARGRDRSASRSGPGCRSPRTSPARSSAGSSTPRGGPRTGRSGQLLAGTMDTWLLWNLTGGPDGELSTSPTSPTSRTLLMDLRTLAWDEEIAAEMRVPTSLLPEISSSSRVYGTCRPGILLDVPVAGILGDQQAATFELSLPRAGHRQEHVRHRQLHAPQHRRGDRALAARPADDRLLPGSATRHRSMRSKGPSPSRGPPRRVAAGQPRHHRRRIRDRDAGGVGGRQRRRLLRARLLGPLRAPLAAGRARRARRPDPVRQQGDPSGEPPWRPQRSRPARCSTR